jgi:hypothetical protein
MAKLYGTQKPWSMRKFLERKQKLQFILSYPLDPTGGYHPKPLNITDH